MFDFLILHAFKFHVKCIFICELKTFFFEQRTSNYEGYFSFLSRIFLTKTMSKTISKKKEKEKSFCQKYNGRINFTHTHNRKSNVN